MKFLYNPESFQKDVNHNFFHSTSKNDIHKTAKQFLNRLFKHSNNESDSSSDGEKTLDCENEKLPLQKQLDLTIEATMEKFTKSKENKFQSIIREFNIFECTGKRTSNLQQLLDILYTVKPTSTQNERNFSTANDFVTKKRSNLADQTLNALCFLKNYFKSKN